MCSCCSRGVKSLPTVQGDDGRTTVGSAADARGVYGGGVIWGGRVTGRVGVCIGASRRWAPAGPAICAACALAPCSSHRGDAMFTVGPPKPEPKCPLGRVNVLSSGSTPVGYMRLQEFTWVVLLFTGRCGAQGGETVPTKSTTSSATSVLSGPGPSGKTVEGNWLGELLHPRREGSTTVVCGGLAGVERRCSRAANLSL